MAQEQLNLFLSYNRDTELIENNLTRTFIVALSLITPGARQDVHSRLLSSRLLAGDLPRPDLALDSAALQITFGKLSRQPLGLLCRIEGQGRRVDAVALAGRLGTVGEPVTEVAAAAGTADLGLHHAA